MITQLSCILRDATRQQNSPLNILTAPTHLGYQSNLSTLNAIFYLWQHKSFVHWESDKTRPLPQNHILLDESLNQNQLPPWVDLDIVWSQNKFGQFQILSQIAQSLRLPLISLDHTTPMPGWSKSHLHELKKMSGNINVFISEYSRDRWLYKENEAEVIRHGINTEVFKPLNLERKLHCTSIVNDWINRDLPCGFTTWQQITNFPNKTYFPVHVRGNTPRLSTATSSIKELVQEYNTSLIFLNTSQHSPIPTTLLESMACGCCPISTATCAIPEVIKHGENGLLSNNPLELRQYCLDMLESPSLARQFGERARQTILDKYPLEKFVQSWDGIFRKALQL